MVRQLLTLRRALLALWLALGAMLLLVLVAQRYSEAKEVADLHFVARDMARHVRLEAMRKPREVLQELAARGQREPALSNEELVQRAKPLAQAGFVITVQRRGELVAAAPAPASVPAIGPNVLTVSDARYLAGAGFDRHPADAFLFPVAHKDKVALAKVLGFPSASFIQAAAIVVDKTALQRSAQGLLVPGAQLAIYKRGVRQVNLVGGAEAAPALELAREPLPLEAQHAGDDAVDLSRGITWPGFLLLGGSEYPGTTFRDEQRQGKPHDVVYLRDHGSTADDWNGLALAFPREGEARQRAWPAGAVVAGLLAYLLVGALAWRVTRPKGSSEGAISSRP